MIRLRPSLVTSIGPSPVRGFIAAMRNSPPFSPRTCQPGRAVSAWSIKPLWQPEGAAVAEHLLNAFVLACLLLSCNYPYVANRWTFPAASD
jgi:hypothetical protein